MNLRIGAHLYRNCDGTIEIEGIPQIEITLRKPGGPLRVNFAILDDNGNIRAKVSDSSIVLNERRQYELTKTQTSFVLTNSESGEQVLHMELQAGDQVVISHGKFYSLKGHSVNISPSEWSVGQTTVKDGETDLKGQSVSLG